MIEIEIFFYYMQFAIETIEILPDWLIEALEPYLVWITFPWSI